MRKGTALLLLAWGLCLTGKLAAQQDPEDSMGRTLPTGMPVELPTLEKSKHIPTEPDELAPKARRQKAFDRTQARRQALELAELAQKIPPQVDQISKNVLPKDLVQQLKQIEKLAKRLRAEVAE
jgi:hypothetical protein